MGRIAKRLALVCVVLLTVGGGVAYATGTIDPFVAADGTISACVQKASGDVKIVQPGTGCNARSEVALSWNQQGPAGAAFVGSGCSLPNGTPGTVQETVDPTGMISFTCHTEPSGGSTGGGTTGGGTATDECPATLPEYPNSTTYCDPPTGQLSLACAPGWGDVDGDITNGCEDDLTTDVHNCGSVGNDVTTEDAYLHATLGCVAGKAVLVACDQGWSDADGNPVDGCELASDPSPVP